MSFGASGENFETDTSDYSYFVAAADLRNYQYRIVYMASEKTVGLASTYAAGTALPLGILQNKPNTGQVAKVRIKGISRVKTDDTDLAVGDQYGPNSDSPASGKAIKMDADKDIILGECIVASNAAHLATVTVDGGIKITISKT